MIYLHFDSNDFTHGAILPNYILKYYEFICYYNQVYYRRN